MTRTYGSFDDVDMKVDVSSIFSLLRSLGIWHFDYVYTFADDIQYCCLEDIFHVSIGVPILLARGYTCKETYYLTMSEVHVSE